MLIENAIKHNEISVSHPLIITLYKQGDFIVVENKLRKKSNIQKDSPGVGLHNIISRYEFLSNKKVEIEEDNNRFLVRLPILHQEN